MRIAVPITATTMDQALRDMDQVEVMMHRLELRDTIIVELRIDYLINPDIKKLLRHFSIPKIVTNRNKAEGGMFAGSEDERIALLQEAVDLGAEYVDIEFKYYRPLSMAKRKTKLIISYHDFERTPKDLAGIYFDIARLNPNIIKIATKANTHNDSLRMLNLIAISDKGFIGICMGKEGVITRIYGPVLGSYLTFACLSNGKASAPGQLTVAELTQIWELINIK